LRYVNWSHKFRGIINFEIFEQKPPAAAAAEEYFIVKFFFGFAEMFSSIFSLQSSNTVVKVENLEWEKNPESERFNRNKFEKDSPNKNIWCQKSRFLPVNSSSTTIRDGKKDQVNAVIYRAERKGHFIELEIKRVIEIDKRKICDEKGIIFLIQS